MKFLIPLLLFAFNACAQDTTVIISPYPCDSMVTTELPERIFIVGYDTTVIEGTDFTAYYNNEHYANVIGDVTVITPIYDTIPAHDTTYTCHLCGTCYDTSYVVTPIAITIQANSQTKTYGQTFTFTNSGTQISIISGGLKAGDVVATDNAASAGAASTAIAGAYTIALSAIMIMRGATNVTSEYTILFQPGTLTVTQLPITVTANNQGKVAGSVFTFTNNGTQVQASSLVSGDILSFDNAASAGAVASVAAGAYAITLSSVVIFKGAANVTSSYAITYVNGTLTVAAAPLIITVTAKNQTKIYGSTFTFTHNGSQVGITSGGLVSGDVITVDNAASTGSGSAATVGSYAISLSSITIMRGATNVTGLYTITYASGTLTVTAIPITIQANNQTKIEGNAFVFLHNGTQVSVVSGSLLSGNAITVDNAASSGSGSGAAVGSYPITLSSATIMNGPTNVTSNYSITYQGGTLTVIGAEPELVINGMLPNYSSTPTTLAQRIAYVQSYSCNAMRSSQDPGSTGWQTTQIHASGLMNTMTYNTAPVQAPPDAFVTAAQRPAALAFFGNLLRTHQNDLPDIITFQNEEPNSNYWSGPVTDYVAWINAATDTAHKYGVPVANGGLLQNVIFYIRWVYQTEGNTAMVNEINKRGHLATGTGTAAQYFIDWYKIEIPALAASNVDFINQHWYEPAIQFGRDLPNSDTTSGLLPIVINFLQTRTGKTVISDEFGTDNASTALFNQLANELNDSGVKVRVYYAGNGDVAELHPDYWKLWIDTHSP